MQKGFLYIDRYKDATQNNETYTIRGNHQRMRDLQLGEWNNITVLWPMPGSLLCQRIVVVEPTCLLVKQFPPLIAVSLLATIHQHIQIHELDATTCTSSNASWCPQLYTKVIFPPNNTALE